LRSPPQRYLRSRPQRFYQFAHEDRRFLSIFSR